MPAQTPPEPPPIDERQRLRDHIAKEAGFRITTVDGLNWICPYTLLVVPSPFDMIETAIESLLERRPWTTGKPKPIAEIQQARWNLWLREKLPQEPRLRLFADSGEWLNPFTGEWVKGIPQGPANALLEGLTTILSACAKAQGGALLAGHTLDELVQKRRNAARRSSESGIGTSPLDGLASGRTSNPIGTSSGIIRPTSHATGSIQRVAPAATPPPAAQPQPAPAPDFDKARKVIDRMLPPIPTLDGIGLQVHYEPMQGIGGDFYDFISIGEGRWLLFLGDVSGHGPEAALVVTAALKALRMLAPAHGDNLVNLLVALNDNLRPDLPQGSFVTCWSAVLDARKRTLTAICAGHHPALLCSLVRPVTLQQVGHKGAAIGVIPGSALRTTLKPDHVQLRDGDLLLQFTDGLFEVHNPQGVEFGRMRCMGSCVANLEHPADVLISRMVREVKKFAGAPLDDDLSVLALTAIPTPKA